MSFQGKQQIYTYLGIVFDLADFNLSRDVITMHKIPTKYKRVLRGKHGMDPT